jgi:hypothetical protein
VRSMLDRELTGLKDWQLLCFKRMRILDMVHSWSLRTHKQHQSKLGVIAKFGSEHDMFYRILRPTALARPPSGPYIGLMWLMEACSLQQTKICGTSSTKFLLNASVWPLQSAASQCQAWDLMISNPDSAFLVDQQKRLICQSVRPTAMALAVHCLLRASLLASVRMLSHQWLSWIDMYKVCSRTWKKPICQLARQRLAARLLLLGSLRFYYGWDGCGRQKPLMPVGAILMSWNQRTVPRWI